VSKIQTKEKIELRARLAKSRYEQSLKLVVGARPVLPTADRTIPEKRSARALSIHEYAPRIRCEACWSILFDWWIGLSRTPDKISAETFALARKFRGRECGQHDELARPDDDGAPGQAAPRRRRGGGTGLRQHLAGLPYGPGVARARIRAVAEPAFPHHVGSGVASVEGLWQSDLPFSISSTSCFPSTIAGHIGDLDGKNGSYFTPRVTLISMANALSSAA
jgi:hypothetical protein